MLVSIPKPFVPRRIVPDDLHHKTAERWKISLLRVRSVPGVSTEAWERTILGTCRDYCGARGVTNFRISVA